MPAGVCASFLQQTKQPKLAFFDDMPTYFFCGREDQLPEVASEADHGLVEDDGDGIAPRDRERRGALRVIAHQAKWIDTDNSQPINDAS
jgi:hypothetical protein